MDAPETPKTRPVGELAKTVPQNYLHGLDPDEIEPRILMLREAFVATGQWWGAALCERALRGCIEREALDHLTGDELRALGWFSRPEAIEYCCRCIARGSASQAGRPA